MKVASIHIYPVKSCAPIDLDNAEVTEMGIDYDRRWMLVDNAGRFLTARRYHRMLHIGQELDSQELVLSYPDKAPLVTPANSIQGAVRRVKVWDDVVDAVDCGDSAADWFSKILKTRCRLVHIPDANARIRQPLPDQESFGLSFADGYPLLVCTQESLAGLNARLDSQTSMRRFRPNIVLAGAVSAFAEDNWSNLEIGSSGFAVSSRCSRCILTTVNPQTAQKSEDGEPLKTLKTFRGGADGNVYFGMNLQVKKAGQFAIGSAASAAA